MRAVSLDGLHCGRCKKTPVFEETVTHCRRCFRELQQDLMDEWHRTGYEEGYRAARRDMEVEKGSFDESDSG